jgi:hypothetical protein
MASEHVDSTSGASAFTDTERLDFMLKRTAFVVGTKTDAGGMAYQLFEQDEDEAHICLSGETLFFNTARGAIDAALRELKSANI